MYSLVSSPVIGFDLVRHPSGTAVAGVLLETLALDAAGAALFDISGVDDADRGAAWFEIDAVSGASMVQVLQEVRERLAGQVGAESADPTDGSGQLDGMLSRLQAVGIGGLDDLLRLVRADILDWAPREVATLACDAVAVAYAGGTLSRPASRRLCAPWLAGWQAIIRHGGSASVGQGGPAAGSPQAGDMGPLDGELRALLDRAGRLTPAELAGLSDPAGHGTGNWAQLVHEATWAAYVFERLRPVANAQLRLVQALRNSGVQPSVAAIGVWNEVSGCVQALAVRDVLPDETFDALTTTWREKVGPLG